MVLFCKKRHILSSPLIQSIRPESNDAKVVFRRNRVEEVQLKSRDDGRVSQPKVVAFLSQDRLSFDKRSESFRCDGMILLYVKGSVILLSGSL